jgi:hypothetical protein
LLATEWRTVLNSGPDSIALEYAISEATVGIYLLAPGLYRPAFMSLRLFLELALATIHFSVNPGELVDLLLGVPVFAGIGRSPIDCASGRGVEPAIKLRCCVRRRLAETRFQQVACDGRQGQSGAAKASRDKRPWLRK